MSGVRFLIFFLHFFFFLEKSDVNRVLGQLYIHLVIVVGQRQRQRVLREPDGLAVAPHVGVSADGVPHLREAQVADGDGAATEHLEARLAVEGDEEVLAHEHRPAHVGQTAEVLQVAPHQDGPFALLAERAVHGQHVDVDGGAAGFVEGQRVLEGREGKRMSPLNHVCAFQSNLDQAGVLLR